MVAAIKAIDETPLYDVAETFNTAATRAVRRLSNAIEYRTGDGAEVATVGRLEGWTISGARPPGGCRR